MSNATEAVRNANNEFNSALSTQKGSTLDKDSFLLLLVTQFKYQDPLNPMEDKEFISQLSQFSSLEQLMNISTGMEGLTSATNNQQMINATSYIGKNVTVSGYDIGKVTDAEGNATITRFRYAPGDEVKEGFISVRDASNNVIYSEAVSSKAAGTTYDFRWNGQNSFGLPAPDGIYAISLDLKNAKGDQVLCDQVVDAKVTGVVTSDGTVYLGLEGGQMMELAKVRQVTLPEVVVANNTNNGSGTDPGNDPGTSTP